MHVFIRNSRMHFKSRVRITFFFKVISCPCLSWKEAHTVLLDNPAHHRELPSYRLRVDTCLTCLVKSCHTEATDCKLVLFVAKAICEVVLSACTRIRCAVGGRAGVLLQMPGQLWEVGAYYRKNIRLKRKFRSTANQTQGPRILRGISAV